MDPGQTPASEVRVYVSNQYEIPLEIFVDGNGIHHRLGVVAATTQRMFVLPRALVGNGPIEFQATPTGSGPQTGLCTYCTPGAAAVIRSEQLQVMPGHVVDFEITTNLVGSRATIRL